MDVEQMEVDEEGDYQQGVEQCEGDEEGDE